MSHGDYNCCALCDKKLAYSNGPTTKEEVCSVCAVELFKLTGESITTGENLVEWIKKSSADVVRSVLADRYDPCIYGSDVDDAVNNKIGDK